MKLKIPYSPNTLNSYIGYVFKNNVNITMADLRNLQKLIEMSDISIYNGKPKIKRRLEFLQKALEARLNKRFADEGIILNFCKPDIDDPYINEIINNVPAYKKLNYNEIQYITNDVLDKLRYGTIQDHKERIVNVLERIDSQEIESYSQAFLLIRQVIKDMDRDFKKIDKEVNDGLLLMNDPDIKTKIEDMIAELGRDQGNLISGIQHLNTMIGGYWHATRLYTFLAPPAGGKSLNLLKVAVDAVRYNSETYKCRKEGLTPCALYISHENLTSESVGRIFNMSGCVGQMESYDSAYVTKRLENMGIINNPNFQLVMAYKSNMSVTTDYVKDLIEELEEQGLEVAIVVHDYLKRIRSAEKADNEIEMLKHVTNELKTIAVDYGIPVISAAQINRSNLQIIEQAIQNGNQDSTKLITGSGIGSSFAIMENSDVLIALNLTKTSDDKRWMAYHRIKMRYGCDTELTYFAQPISTEGFYIMDDIMLDKPLGVISLSSDMVTMDESEMMSNRGRRQIGKVKDLPVKDESALNDIFNLTPLNSVV